MLAARRHNRLFSKGKIRWPRTSRDFVGRYLAVDAVLGELVSALKFPVTGIFTGNFAPHLMLLVRFTPVFPSRNAFSKPLSSLELGASEQGICLNVSGNFKAWIREFSELR